MLKENHNFLSQRSERISIVCPNCGLRHELQVEKYEDKSVFGTYCEEDDKYYMKIGVVPWMEAKHQTTKELYEKMFNLRKNVQLRMMIDEITVKNEKGA